MTEEKKNEPDDKRKHRRYKLAISIDKSPATKHICDMYAMVSCDSLISIDCNIHIRIYIDVKVYVKNQRILDVIKIMYFAGIA